MADSVPPQHYLPIYAPARVNKFLAKIAFKLAPAGPNQYRKISHGKGKTAPKSGKGGKR